MMRGNVRSIALMLLGGVTLPALAQQSLDDLERRIDSARLLEKKQQEASVAQRRAQANMATLVVKSDSACELIVNGSGQGSLSADVTKAVKVPPGEQLIECRSASGAVTQETKTVAAGAQAVLMLSMPRIFDSGGGGVMVQSQAGRQWTQSDNGYDIDWQAASQWCSKMIGDWRLPSIDELLALGKPAGFRFTGSSYWTNERNGSSEAWLVSLDWGRRGSSDVSRSKNFRVLCVRS